MDLNPEFACAILFIIIVLLLATRDHGGRRIYINKPPTMPRPPEPPLPQSLKHEDDE